MTTRAQKLQQLQERDQEEQCNRAEPTGSVQFAEDLAGRGEERGRFCASCSGVACRMSPARVCMWILRGSLGKV